MKDVIVGKIYFLLVRIKIKHMELSVIRRETTGAGKYKILPIFAFHREVTDQHIIISTQFV